MYERALLRPAEEKSILGQFFGKKTIPQNSGDTITFRKAGRIEPRMEPLLEGQIPAPNSFQLHEYKATIQEYGDHILYSSKIQKLAVDKNLIPTVVQVFGNSFKKFIEKKRVELLSTTKNIYFAGIDVENDYDTLAEYKDALATSTDNIGVNLEDLSTINAMASRNDVEDLVIVIPPEAKAALQSLKKSNDKYSWIDINQGQQKQYIYNNGIGEIFGVVFVESNAIQSYKYTTTDKATTVNFADCYILGKVNGEWGAVETSLSGEGYPNLIHHKPGSSGANDPFNQKASIAWSTFYGGILPYEEAVIRYVIKLSHATFKRMEESNRGYATKQVTYDSAKQETVQSSIDSSKTEIINTNVVTPSTVTTDKVVKTPVKNEDGSYEYK